LSDGEGRVEVAEVVVVMLRVAGVADDDGVGIIRVALDDIGGGVAVFFFDETGVVILVEKEMVEDERRDK